MNKYFVFAVIILLSFSLYAKEYALYYTINDSLKIGLTGTPYFSYTSESGLGLGLTFILYERSDTKTQVYGQDFNMRFGGDMTMDGEYEMSIRTSIPLRKYQQRIRLDTEYKKKSREYNGIGGNTTNENPLSFLNEHYKFQGIWEKNLRKDVKIGIAWDYSGQKNIHENQNYKDNIEYPIGFDKFYRTAGIGPLFIITTKNPNNFPTNGIYYENKLLFYDEKISSNYNFTIWMQEFQIFIPIDNHVIANQIISHNAFNNIPFHYYPQQGSSTMMRGYQSGRFLDEQFLGIQSEYRSPIIFSRISAVAFAASAISYKGISDFREQNIHFTGGFGFRFALDKKERVNARADIGFSEEGYQLYLKFGEAF